MAVYLRDGLSYYPTSDAALDLHRKLPAGNFIVKKNPKDDEFYFVKVDDFPPLGKVYGDVVSKSGRIINTFNDRAVSTGVLLAGEKGSGKTMLAKKLAIDMYEAGHPTIIINEPHVGDKFNRFIQDLNQPAAVMFDEFEKVYDHKDQMAILTLLDGVFPSKKLFLLTCNDKFRIDHHMNNRPGRIYYSLNFVGLESDFIIEYCNDMLKNTIHIATICKVATMFYQFNFDLLKALVEEMNRYDEDPLTALEMLNAKPDADRDCSYSIELILADGKKSSDIYPTSITTSPLNIRRQEITHYEKDNDGDDSTSVDYYFTIENLHKIDGDGNKFIFINADKQQAIFTKNPPKPFKYGTYLTV